MEAALIRDAALQDTARNCPTSSATLAVPDMVCGACMTKVEAALLSCKGVVAARANLASRRVSVTFNPDKVAVDDLSAVLQKRGFAAAELQPGHRPALSERVNSLIPRVGVAGFAAANIMLLSVSVWSGNASDMDGGARTLFHWLSAAMALPAVAYAGQPFFRSAARALRGRRLNMDVPISLGILLATAMSLFQAARGTDQVYFDAATMLVFFLLIGRALDEHMRTRTRSAAENLISMRAVSATVLNDDGTTRRLAARLLLPGMKILVAPGERVAVDGRVLSGASELDVSLVTGETAPRAVSVGSFAHGGTVNGSGLLTLEALSSEENSLLSEIGRLMLAAEQDRGRYVRLADRAARIYAPAVHILGLSTFALWMLHGAGWEQALTYAIAVLIITCPCALALAVPAVQVAATSRLFGSGIILKAADGLERLAECTGIVFDKTGTLTKSVELADAGKYSDDVLRRAAALAVSSRHPYAVAIVAAARARALAVTAAEHVTEVSGSGLSAIVDGAEEKLGSQSWTGANGNLQEASLWYVRSGCAPVPMSFNDIIREDAAGVISAFKRAGYSVEIVSGDRPSPVHTVAAYVGVGRWLAKVKPGRKAEHLKRQKDAGRNILMVGDGLNDAAALAVAHASLSPSTAADVSQNAADAIFQGEKLQPVLTSVMVARAARRLALENFAIAILYNAAFVPAAMLGYVTPLVAALAMSTSSLLVTANSLRLKSMKLTLPALQRGAP